MQRRMGRSANPTPGASLDQEELAGLEGELLLKAGPESSIGLRIRQPLAGGALVAWCLRSGGGFDQGLAHVVQEFLQAIAEVHRVG